MAYLDRDRLMTLLLRVDRGYQLTNEEAHWVREQRASRPFYVGITELPQSIRILIKLTNLDLSDTRLIALPDSIGTLTNLSVFNLSETDIYDLSDSIGSLTNLCELYLGNTGLSALPDSIGDLSNLRYLDLSNTGTTALPDAVRNLTALETMFLSGTKLPRVPELIGDLRSLRNLYLNDTAITELPDCLFHLNELEKLYLGNTGVTDLPDWIGKFPKLKRLDLRNLTLPEIPRSLAESGLPFVDEEHFGIDELGVNLHGVTLTNQNLSVFLESPELIPDLYRGQIALRECKVIFLGDGDSGKTYTIRRFRNEGLPEGEGVVYQTSETLGVEILDYTVASDTEEDPFRIHFWDFGGQQILHSMHRCFLTEQSCYVVTVKTRETEATKRARYWLQNVMAFAPKSPVLLFVNCWDNADGRHSIDESRLRRDFPQIKDVVYCSAKTASQAEFRTVFMERLLQVVKEAGLLQFTINDRWDRLRQAIQAENRDVLPRERYLALCKDCRVKDADAVPLLSYLNNLGVCFSYHRDRDRRELADYKLLQPVWLTNALYAIIEEGSIYAQGGILNLEAIQNMLAGYGPLLLRDREYRRTVPELTYKPQECRYILEVAQAHSLCYEAEPGRLFFPALCEADSPPEALEPPKDYPQHLVYQLKYVYLPNSVVHRLMIRCRSRELVVRVCWLQGMVLAAMEAHRVVIQMENDETLQIDLYSKPEHPAWEVFQMIRAEIVAVNEALNLPQPREFILDGEDRYSMQTLFGALGRSGLVYGPETGNERNAAELLGQFYTDWSLRQLQVEEKRLVLRIPPRSWHRCQQNDPKLRKALFTVYKGICPYCKRSFTDEREFEVDHILPTHFDAEAHPELKEYLAYLKASDINTDKPDYVENYFPAHPSCNRDKSNRINVFTLPAWHELAARNAPKVLDLMEHPKKSADQAGNEAAR